MSAALEHFSKLFADDSKIIAVIKNLLDCGTLQSDLEKLSKSANEWKLRFN